MSDTSDSVAVAASGQRTDACGIRQPAGEVHAWRHGRNETVCGLSLSRSRLGRFPHVPFDFQATDVLTSQDPIGRICPHCLAALRPRRRRVRPGFRRP